MSAVTACMFLILITCLWLAVRLTSFGRENVVSAGYLLLAAAVLWSTSYKLYHPSITTVSNITPVTVWTKGMVDLKTRDTTFFSKRHGKIYLARPVADSLLPVEYRLKALAPSERCELLLTNHSYLLNSNAGGMDVGEICPPDLTLLPSFRASIRYSAGPVTESATFSIRDYKAIGQKAAFYSIPTDRQILLSTDKADKRILVVFKNNLTAAPQGWLHSQLLIGIMLLLGLLVLCFPNIQKQQIMAGILVSYVVIAFLTLISIHYIWCICICPPTSGNERTSLNLSLISYREHWLFYLVCSIYLLAGFNQLLCWGREKYPALSDAYKAASERTADLLIRKLFTYLFPLILTLILAVYAHGRTHFPLLYLLFGFVYPYLLLQLVLLSVRRPSAVTWYIGYIGILFIIIASLGGERGMTIYYCLATLPVFTIVLCFTEYKRWQTVLVGAGSIISIILFTHPFLITNKQIVRENFPRTIIARADALLYKEQPSKLLMSSGNIDAYNGNKKAISVTNLLQYRSGSWYADDGINRLYTLPYFAAGNVISLANMMVNDEAGSMIAGMHSPLLLPLLFLMFILAGIAFASGSISWLRSLSGLIWVFMCTYLLLAILSNFGNGYFSGVDFLTISATGIVMKSGFLFQLLLMLTFCTTENKQVLLKTRKSPLTPQVNLKHAQAWPLSIFIAFIILTTATVSWGYATLPAASPRTRIQQSFTDVANNIIYINERYAERWEETRKIKPLKLIIRDTTTIKLLAGTEADSFKALTWIILKWAAQGKNKAAVHMVLHKDGRESIAFTPSFENISMPAYSDETRQVPIVSVNYFEPTHGRVQAAINNEPAVSINVPMPGNGFFQDSLIHALPGAPDNLDLLFIPARFNAKGTSMIISAIDGAETKRFIPNKFWILNNQKVPGKFFAMYPGDMLFAKDDSNPGFFVNYESDYQYFRKPVWVNGQIVRPVFSKEMPYLKGVSTYLDAVPERSFHSKPYETSLSKDLSESLVRDMNENGLGLDQYSITVINSFGQLVAAVSNDRQLEQLRLAYPAQTTLDSLLRVQGDYDLEERLARGNNFIRSGYGQASITKILFAGTAILGGMDPKVIQALSVKSDFNESVINNLLGQQMIPLDLGNDVTAWSTNGEQLNIQSAFIQSKNAFFATLLTMAMHEPSTLKTNIAAADHRSFLTPYLSGISYSLKTLPSTPGARYTAFTNEHSIFAKGLIRLGLPIAPDTRKDALAISYGDLKPNLSAGFIYAYPATSHLYLQHLSAEKSATGAYNLNPFFNTVAGGGAACEITDVELCTQITQIFSGKLEIRPSYCANPIELERHHRRMSRTEISAMQEFIYSPLSLAWHTKGGTSAYLYPNGLDRLTELGVKKHLYIKTGTSDNSKGKHLVVIISNAALESCSPEEVVNARSVVLLIKRHHPSEYESGAVQLRKVFLPVIQTVYNSSYTNSLLFNK